MEEVQECKYMYLRLILCKHGSIEEKMKEQCREGSGVMPTMWRSSSKVHEPGAQL